MQPDLKTQLDLLFEHDLFRKPVSTFRDHALQNKQVADVLLHRRRVDRHLVARAVGRRDRDFLERARDFGLALVLGSSSVSNLCSDPFQPSMCAVSIKRSMRA